jgi:hypothetical protein
MFRKFVEASRLKTKTIRKAHKQMTNTVWTSECSVPNQPVVIFTLFSFYRYIHRDKNLVSCYYG